MDWSTDKTVKFFLFLCLLFLAFVFFALIWKYTSFVGKSGICGDFFQSQPSINASARTFINCGVYETTPDTVFLLGKLEDISIDNNMLITKIQINESSELKTYKFNLGKIDTSYTWITLKKDKKIYDPPDEFKKINPAVNRDLFDKLKTYKDSYITFSILTSADLSLYKKLLSSPNYEYKEDLLFRYQYFSKCNSFLRLPLSVEKVIDKCGSIHIHGLTLYKTDLML